MFRNLTERVRGGKIRGQLRRRQLRKQRGQRRLQLESLEDRRLLAVDVGLNFESSRFLSDSNFFPPDTMGDVGPNHIAEMINGNFQVFNKTTGASIISMSLDDFWTGMAGATIPTGFTFDPRILFDAQSGRWFASSINGGAANTIFLARSDTSDPTGDWDSVQFIGDTLDGNRFNDYDTLGVDATGVYISTNNFGPVFDVAIFSIPKADLLLDTPTAANLTQFEAENPAIRGTSIQPAVDFGAPDGSASLLGTSGSTVIRTDVLGAGGPGATLTASANVVGAPAFAAAPAARQPSGVTIENVTPRFTGNVVEVNGQLWAAHAVAGSAGNSAIRWYQIDEATNTVVQTGLIEDTSTPLDFLDPSIAVNGFGLVAIGYTASGPSTFASAMAVVGTTVSGAGGPVTTFGAPILLAAGAGNYRRAGGSGRNRWGDYSATRVDPSDPLTFWTFQEFVAAAHPGPDFGTNGGLWGTQVSELTVHSLDLVINGDNTDNNITVRAAAGGTVEVLFGGVVTDRFPLAALNSLVINGQGGDDLLTVDLGTGNPIPVGGLTFHGGANGGVGDKLQVVNGVVGRAAYDASGPGMGALNLDGSTITFTGLEPIAIVPAALGTLDINITDGLSHTLTLSDDGGVAGVSFVDIDGGLEDAFFTNPSVALNINTSPQADFVNVFQLDPAFLAALNINTLAGDDVVNVLGTMSGVTTTIDTGLGAFDDVFVGRSHLAAPGSGSLAALAGHLVLNDADVDYDITIDNGADAAARTWTIDSPSPVRGRVGLAGVPGTITYNSLAANSVSIAGGGGDDQFTLDLSGGNPSDPLPFGPLALAGGGQTSGDSIVLQGASLNRVTHTFFNENDGSVSFDDFAPNNSLLSYAGFEPILDNLNVANRVFTFLSPAPNATLTASPVNPALLTRIDSSVNELVDFTTPTNSLTINLTGAGNTISLQSFAANYGTPTNTINGSAGSDIVNIGSTGAVAGTNWTINGAGDNDTVNLSPMVRDLSDLFGRVTFNGGAGLNDVFQIFDDNRAAGDTYDVTSTTLDRAGWGGAGYDGAVEQIHLSTGGGNDVIRVHSTSGAATTTLHGQGDDDTVHLSPVARDLTNLPGRVVFSGGGGAGDVLNLFDDNRAAGDTYDVTSSTVDRAGWGGATYDAAVEFLNLSTGDGSDLIHVHSTSGAATTTLNSQGDSDTVNLSPVANDLSNLAGRVFYNGGSGAPDLLNMFDDNRAAGDTYAVTGTTVDRAGWAGVTYDAAVEQLVLFAGDGADTINVTSTSGTATFTIHGQGGNDTVHLSPVARDLSNLPGRVIFNGGPGATDIFNLFDDNRAAGDVYTITSSTVDRAGWGGASYDGAVEQLNLATGDGDDTLNVNSTSGTATTSIDGQAGNDHFQVNASQLGGLNNFAGSGGEDRFHFQLTSAAAISATANVDGGSQGAGLRDVVELNDVFGLALNGLFAFGAGSQASLTGLGSPLNLQLVELFDFNGSAAADDVLTVRGTAGDDLISVAPIGLSRALVFNNSPGDASGPFNGPPEIFGNRILGVDGGSARPDLDLSGLHATTGLTIDDAGGVNDRLYLYGRSDAGLSSGAPFDAFGFGPGRLLPAVGPLNAFDVIAASDTATTINGFRVNYDNTDFVQPAPATQPAVVINTGFEGNPPATPGIDIADDTVVALSAAYRFQVNGGNPDPATTGIVPPDGDRLRVTSSGTILNLFSDKNTPPNVTLDYADDGLLSLGYSSIENLLLNVNGGTVNLIGDNNDPLVDQPDNFVVVGRDVDGNPADGGFQEMTVRINGSAPISVDNFQFLNVFGDDQNPPPGTPSVANDLDTLDIRPYADNTPRGWGVDVRFDEGNPVQVDGAQADLIIYRTSLWGGPVSENIVVQPSAPEAGQIRVTNASFGTPVVNISYVNNLDIVIHDDDGFSSDTDTVTIRGTTADTPGASGRDRVVVNTLAAGDVANPKIVVTDLNPPNPALPLTYRIRDLTNIRHINIETLGGVDEVQIRADANTSFFVDGGTPTGGLQSPGDSLNVQTAGAAVAFSAGPESDEGAVDVTGARGISFDRLESLLVDGVLYVRPDSLEPNNTLGTATVLGSHREITLRDRTLHGTVGSADNVSGTTTTDVDYYRVTANATGYMAIQALFSHAQGDIDLEVRDAGNNVIASATSTNDNELIQIPVVAQQTYFVRVHSFDTRPNTYALEIENFAAAVPTAIDLVDQDDSGRSNLDNVTRVLAPNLLVHADLSAFSAASIPILSAAQAAAGNVAGVAVEVFRNGISLGFANAVGGLDNLFSFTPTGVQTTSGTPIGPAVSPPVAADAFGFLNLMTAAVRVFDRQVITQTGRTNNTARLSLVVDPNNPNAALTSLELLAASDTNIIGDGVTNIRQPAFWGIAEANTRIRIFAQRAGGQPEMVGEAQVGSDLTDGAVAGRTIGGRVVAGLPNDGLGLWEITVEPLRDGIYQFSVVVEDLAGNVTDRLAGPLVSGVVVDTVVPQRPTIDLIDLDDTGNSDKDNVTIGDPTKSVGVADFRISAEANSTVVIKDGEVVIDSFVFNTAFDLTDGVVDGFGVRTIDFVANQTSFAIPAEGPHPLSAESFDLAGNRSAQSEELLVTIDFTDPLAPSAPDLAADADTGLSPSDNITAINELVVLGVGEANAIVRVFARNAQTGTVQLVGIGQVQSDESDIDPTNGLGIWELTLEPLADATYLVWAELEDQAGNISSQSATLSVQIDTLPPQRPTTDLIDLDDTGESDKDNVTIGDPTKSNGVADFRISAEPGTRVFVKDGEVVIASFVFDAAFDLTDGVTDGFGVLTIDFVANQGSFGIPTQGPHPLSTESFDVAGNRSHQSEELLVTIDFTAPATPAAPDLATDADTGVSDSDNVTALRQLVVQGVGEANAIVRAYATYTSTGATQLVGIGRVQSDESDGVATNGQGVWELTLEPLDDGVYDVTVEFEDQAGNISGRSAALRVEIDTVVPNTPFLDMFEADDSGRHNDDNVTNVRSPRFTATTQDPNAAFHTTLFPAGPHLRYRVFDRGEGTTETLIYDSGFTAANLVTTAGLTLADGHHNLKLEVEDRAGNISADYLLTVVIDTIAPPLTITGILSTDTGVTGTPGTLADRVTSDLEPKFVGRAEANAIVRLYVDGREGVNNDNNAINNSAEFALTVSQPLDGDEAQANGQWSTQFVRNLNDPAYFDLDGVREVLATAEDLAGNVSLPQVLDIFVDTRGPQVSDIRITGSSGYNLFDPKPTQGPTPLVNSLSISIRDLAARSNQDPNFLYAALDAGVATQPGNYSLIGDATGAVAISSITFTATPPTDNAAATGTIQLNFARPLPDDRFTLRILDRLVDPAGNSLDGETNTAEPNGSPQFPSGDGRPGNLLLARFTVDTRPEIGTWAGGTAWVDTNGNGTFDPTNVDLTNRDIVYAMGLVTDDFFAGNFSPTAASVADGFDKLAAYGFVNGAFRWLIDTNNDGIADIIKIDPTGVNGLPVAGNFDGNAANGDEVAVFDGRAWHFDTDHDFEVGDPGGSFVLNTSMRGYPIVGDFNGDGRDDLATWTDDRFQIDLAAGPGPRTWDGVADFTFRFGFIGVRERPVAADMNKDGFEDLGLWVPDREGVVPTEGSEWYFLVSNGAPIMNRIRFDIPLGTNVVDYHPTPFGNDLYFQYGDQYALPIVGNFDPPVDPDRVDPEGNLQFNTKNIYDVNGDGLVNVPDLMIVLREMGSMGSRPLAGSAKSAPYLDVVPDGKFNTLDVMAELRYLALLNQGGVAEGEHEQSAFMAYFSDLGTSRKEKRVSSDAELESILNDIVIDLPALDE